MFTLPRFFNSARTCVRALIALLLFTGSLSAQDEDLKFIDYTYVDYIKTVRFHINGFPHSYPLIELNGGAQLLLSFDDLNDEVRRYSYKFIHCDANWEPSGLSPLEFNSGYSVDYLEDYDFSLRTLMEYVHYDLVFPNRNMKLDVSGNYLLVVYDEEDDAFPVITRRFMVQESLAGVSGRIMRPAAVDKIHSHQEVDLQVNTKQLGVSNPMRELRAAVIQNNRWDNAITNIMPSMLQRESVQFDYQDRVVFRGGNEFRNLDIRSIRAPRTEMVSITNEGDRYAMMMLPDRPRDNGTYIGYFDLNGDYVNFRFDQDVINLTDEVLRENFSRLDVAYTGEYVEQTFVFSTGTEMRHDVYLFGAFTEYQLKPEFRMVWNPAISSYVGRTLIKQGFYNYYYVTDRAVRGEDKLGSARISYEDTEGSFDETENNYLGLIYWRPIGGRYDRLVGSAALNSNAN